MSDDRLHESQIRGAGVLADEAIPLAETALHLAALDRPGKDLAPYLAHLDAIASALAQKAGGADSATAQVRLLASVMHGDFEYQGDSDTYDDMKNANLMSVIDRRRGLPVALAILYLHAAQSVGWHVEGINFPGHFVLRLEAGGERVIFDPFNAGDILETDDLQQILKSATGEETIRPEHYAPVGTRDILLRLLNNIATRALNGGDPDRAKTILERMTWIDSSRASLWRDIGLLEARSGNLTAAVAALSRCVERARASGERQLLAEAEAALGSLNKSLN